VHQNLPFAKGNRPEGEERGLQSPGLGGKSHLIDHLHPAGRRVAMQSDGASQAGEICLRRVGVAHLDRHRVHEGIRAVLDQRGAVVRSRQLGLAVRHGHRMPERGVDEMLVAIRTEVSLGVSATTQFAQHRVLVHAHNERADVVLVVHLPVVPALGGQDQGSGVGRMAPREHPRQAAVPVPLCRMVLPGRLALHGPQERAKRPVQISRPGALRLHPRQLHQRRDAKPLREIDQQRLGIGHGSIAVGKVRVGPSAEHRVERELGRFPHALVIHQVHIAARRPLRQVGDDRIVAKAVLPVAGTLR